MNCPEFQNHLSEYVAGRLPSSQRARMQDHAQACSACAGEAHSERELRSWFGQTPAPPECVDLWPRLASDLRSAPQPRRMLFPSWAFGSASVALAACLCLIWMRPEAPRPVTPVLPSPPAFMAQAADETKLLHLVANMRQTPLAQSDLLLAHIHSDREERSILLRSGGGE